MINFRRIQFIIWREIYKIKHGLWFNDNNDYWTTNKKFKLFVRKQTIKIFLGLPLTYIGMWFLFIQPVYGFSFHYMFEWFSHLYWMTKIFVLPLVGLPFMIITLAIFYTFMVFLCIMGRLQK